MWVKEVANKMKRRSNRYAEGKQEREDKGKQWEWVWPKSSYTYVQISKQSSLPYTVCTCEMKTRVSCKE